MVIRASSLVLVSHSRKFGTGWGHSVLTNVESLLLYHSDVLGPTAFKPVKADISGNIEVRFATHNVLIFFVHNLHAGIL